MLQEDQGLPPEVDNLVPVVGRNFKTSNPNIGDLDNAVAVVDDFVDYWNRDDNPEEIKF